jgi:hypothetical protein
MYPPSRLIKKSTRPAIKATPAIPKFTGGSLVARFEHGRNRSARSRGVSHTHRAHDNLASLISK